MKLFTIMALMTLTLSTKASVGNTPSYYLPKFKVINVESICPENPTGIRCMAKGIYVTVKTTLGSCVDELLVADFKTVQEDDKIKIYGVGLAFRSPDGKYVRCIGANTITKKIFVPNDNFEFFNGKIEL